MFGHLGSISLTESFSPTEVTHSKIQKLKLSSEHILVERSRLGLPQREWMGAMGTCALPKSSQFQIQTQPMPAQQGLTAQSGPSSGQIYFRFQIPHFKEEFQEFLLLAKWIKDPVLLPLWPLQLNPWPGGFHMIQVWLKKKKKNHWVPALALPSAIFCSFHFCVPFSYLFFLFSIAIAGLCYCFLYCRFSQWLVWPWSLAVRFFELCPY